ncbi:UvrD-helicase domain-containing protein [Pontibacillus yanchengensis]|uniref:UvrD-helicase domain-containing protein n=1 Tax=Pontibacillus yanchengensis TaxID=462910 RepID=UPI001369AB4F|nr:UvrD-helicase domain-containing protein [Pontibacillus yanchengensis]
MFKKLYIQLRLLIYSPQINQQLKELEKKTKDLELRQREINNTKVMISDDYMVNVEKDHEYILRYVEGGSCFAFHNKANQMIKDLPSDSTPQKIDLLQNQYIELCDNYNSEFLRLKNSIDQINETLKPYYAGVESYHEEIANLKRDYFANSSLQTMKIEYEDIYSFFKDAGPVTNMVETFLDTYPNLDSLVKDWNKEYVVKELKNNDVLFNNIDGKSLDEQQRRAVIVDEDNNLVVAGAGSGKTLTISGKVRYLVETKNIDPEEIFLVTFTKKAAGEMEERIKKKLNINVEASTFHKLGMNIIGKTSNNKPDVQDEPKEIINKYFENDLYDDPEQLKKIIEYFGYYINVPKDMEEFDNLGEYYDHYKQLEFETLRSKYEENKYIQESSQRLKRYKRTLSGEKVKSLEEVMIANFLFLNGVNYQYEEAYKYSTSDAYRRQYKPDFYLPDYDIYIEHFGINKDNQVPWLNEFYEKEYLEGMEWKRQVHAQNRTNLIETYSYLTNDGVLLETLRQKLLRAGVKFKEVDFIDIFNKIYDTENSNHFTEFVNFVSTFINLFKSNGYDYDMFDELKKLAPKDHSFSFHRTNLFIDIVKPVYEYYQNALKEQHQIDFNDMINDATDAVESGEVNFPYKYLIIDEYQDISVSRFNLINAIKKRTNAKVMAVGDDWQSIYRFAGSDLSLFTKFQEYFGFSEMLKIENTYRNSQELINFAGEFVMKNNQQIKKNLQSAKREEEPIKVIKYNGLTTQEDGTDLIDAFLKVIEKVVQSYGEDAEVMLLGRTNYDIKFLDQYSEFKITKNNNVTYSKYPNLNMFFLTVHKSKGLEADNVIIINGKNDLLGFPNRISDDPLLSLVLTEQDEFTFAEERRLFYVALTRTKNKTFILAPEINESIFVKELIEKQHVDYELVSDRVTLTNNPKCPKCVQGFLLTRENSRNNKQFLGCSNYPKCNHTINDVRVINDQVICSNCKGYMVLRNGPYGEFYGCSNYPSCTNKLKLAEL